MSRIFPNNQTVENSCLKKPKSRRVSTIQAECWCIRSVFSTVTCSMLNSTVTSSAMLQQCMKSCSSAGDFWPHQLDLCLRFIVIIGFYSVWCCRGNQVVYSWTKTRFFSLLYERYSHTCTLFCLANEAVLLSAATVALSTRIQTKFPLWFLNFFHFPQSFTKCCWSVFELWRASRRSSFLQNRAYSCK